MTSGRKHVAATIELDVGRHGLAGTFTRSAEPSGAAVVVLGGSAGGHPGRGYGPALAHHGIDTLALTYFGAPGLPAELHEVPLEHVERALEWLVAQPGPDTRRTSILARSRGTELAQLVALRRPDLVAGLVLGVPTCVLVQAWPGEGAAWTADGVPVPHHPAGWPTGEEITDDPEAVIPIERFDGPVLTVSGGRDELWPSEAFAGVIERRRRRRELGTTTLVYPDAGHGVGRLVPDEEPGDPAADVAARASAWPTVVAHLHECAARA